MKILAIRIKNLASLEETTEIDFTREPLCSAGIFAITGPTGAGKSTVLDALCLALYSKTPRYVQARESGIEVDDVQGSKISQNDVRAILRDGTADGFAEVDFVGVDGDHYRARWSVRRARNKADGALQAAEMGLRNLSKNADIGGRKTDLLPQIERLVGLSFEQFRRSVLLPQGDFTAFLKADKDEKSSLLEKLTGTEVYSEISRRVFERHREELQKLKDLNLRREGIDTLTQEEYDAFRIRKEELESSIKRSDERLERIHKELSWHERQAALKGSCDEAEQLYAIALEARQSAEGRRQRLGQAEQAQAVRTWFDGRSTALDQKSVREKELLNLEDRMRELQAQKEMAVGRLQDAEEALTARIKEREEAQPLLDRARDLDVQIREKEEQSGKAEEDYKAASKKRDEYAEQQKAKEAQSEDLKQQIHLLEEWIKGNAERGAIAENEALITSRLSDTKKQLLSLQSIEDENRNIRGAINEIGARNADLNILLSAEETQLDKLRNHIGEEASALSALSITSIEEEKQKADASVEELIAAEGQWELLYQSLREHDQLISSLQKNRDALSASRMEVLGLASGLEAIKARRDASFRMLQIAQQALSKDVEALRSQLVQGEECPVCGSTEHPYLSADRQLHDLLKEQKAEHEQNESAYSSALTRHSSLQVTCEQLDKQIAKQEEEKAVLDARLHTLQTSWAALSVQNECLLVEDDQKAAWLQEKLAGKRALQAELHGQIRSYYEKKQILEDRRSKAEHLEKSLNDIRNQIKDAERNLHSLTEKKQLNDKNQERIHTDLEEIERHLSPYFASEGWFENWKANPDSFLDRIRTFASQWKLKREQLERSSREYELLVAGVEGMRERLMHLTEDAGKCEESWIRLREFCSRLKDDRHLLFEGKPVTEVEAVLQQAIEAARHHAKEEGDGKAQLEAESDKLQALKEQGQNSVAFLARQAADSSEKISRWLSNYNAVATQPLREETLTELLSLPAEWIEAEGAELRSIDDAVMRSKSIADERRAAYALHEQQRLSELTQDELIVIEKDVKERSAQEREECTGIGIRLRQDYQNKERISELIRAIESQSNTADLWGKLNEIIGSADGKKFRQIAQEYTLDVLLSYANLHLEMLSKRYVLQRIPNSLALQVVDQDMGDEIRTVFSLSGGESFLVSLALALGLASLSSNRMKVESLFIDEGFGSLDPQTLNTAMDALERLHNQGRKVGVISHVQEMTERIPVQIRVSKVSSGKSGISVTGSSVAV